MRWPFGPPHLTLKPSKKNTKRKKNKKKKEKKDAPQKKQQKYQKIAVQLSVKLFLFWVAFQNVPFFDTLAQKAHPPKHYKNRGFRAFFGKQMCVTKRPFLDQKTKIHKFQLSFLFAYFLLLQQQKTQKLLKPLFL